jgi:DNA mismatch repair ATPase MutS
MDKKTVVNDANTAGKAIDAGKRVAAAIKQEIPVAWAAGKTKAMKFNQEIVRPKTEPVAKAILEKGVRPVLDKAIKAKNAAAQWIDSPKRKYIQDYKKDKLKVHFKEAARQPLTLKQTQAEPLKRVEFQGLAQLRGPVTGPAVGDKQAQARQLIARRADPRMPNPAPTPAKRPGRTK